MTYVSRPMGNRLGIYANKIDAIREQRGLTPAGFRQDGTDPLKTEKEAMQRELYRRADAHMCFRAALGGPSQAAPDSEAEGSEEDGAEAP